MKNAFLKPFLLFFVLVAICYGGIGSLYLKARHTVTAGNGWIHHSQDVVIKAERVQRLIERMVADQRGYLLSGESDFQKAYERDKLDMAGVLSDLKDEIHDNPNGETQLAGIQDNFGSFTRLLDDKVLRYKLGPQNLNMADAAHVEKREAGAARRDAGLPER